MSGGSSRAIYIHIHTDRHHRRSGRKVLTIGGREVHRAQNAVDAGEVVAFEVKGGGSWWIVFIF